MLRLARENSGWGYDRIVGALANLGHQLSDQTVGNILSRHGIAPAPKRSQTTTWKDFNFGDPQELKGYSPLNAFLKAGFPFTQVGIVFSRADLREQDP